MDVMKKEIIILVLILICTISGSAQRNRFFLYTQDGYQSSVFSLNIPSDDEKAEYEEKSESFFLSFGAGYYFNNDFSMEVGVFGLNPSVNKTLIVGAKAGVAQYSCITGNVYWGISGSYRLVKYIVNGSSDLFHDFYIEPLIIEIRSKNNHWGFQTSLVGFEVMTHTSRSYDEKTNTFGLNENKFDRKKDMTAFGISFNNISFKVIYYL